MELFVTGGTGYIGQAVARKAISLGHRVTALVRNDRSPGASALVRLGVDLHCGDLREPQSFAAAAGAADGVVHVDDLAGAYLSAVERLASGDSQVIGQRLNVVAEEGVAVAEMGEAIRASVGADRVEWWPLDDARRSLGPFADALALDQTVSGQQARQALAWQPHGPGVIADLASRNHFQHGNGA